MGRLLVAVVVAAVVVGAFAMTGGARTSKSSASKAGRHSAAPAACVDAIKQARIVSTYMVKSLTDVQPLFSMVPAAAKAGLTQNASQIYSIAARLKRIDAQITGIAHSVAPVVSKFNADAARCH